MTYDYKQTKKTTDLFEYEVTVPFEELKEEQEKAYQRLSKTVKISGFRPGKAPRAKVEAKLGMDIINEAIRTLLPKIALEVIKKEDARPANTPSYELKKLDPKDGIVFTISFTDFPKVELGDFSKIKVKREEPKVTEKDIDTVMRSIIKSSLTPEKIREIAGKKSDKKTKKVDSSKKKTTNKESENKNKEKSDKEEIEFEISDELIKELGYDKEKTVEDMRKAVKEKLVEMKLQQNESDYQSKLIEEAIKLSKFEIPKLFVEQEVKNLEAQFNSRLKELKLDAETFLQSQGSTLEDKKKEWEKQAKDRISIDMVLVNLANEHKQVASEDEIDAEIEAIADPQIKQQYKSSNAREYIRTVITRQKGMKKLLEIVESNSKSKK